MLYKVHQVTFSVVIKILVLRQCSLSWVCLVSTHLTSMQSITLWQYAREWYVNVSADSRSAYCKTAVFSIVSVGSYMSVFCLLLPSWSDQMNK